MFEHTSRYYAIPNGEFVTEEGRTIAYKRRRFLPQGESLPLLVEVIVGEGDRLDTIAARVLGDAEQFWRIADANNAMDALDLVEPRPGGSRLLRITLPQP
jgi:nucleoid-associated protein YgaU